MVDLSICKRFPGSHVIIEQIHHFDSYVNVSQRVAVNHRKHHHFERASAMASDSLRQEECALRCLTTWDCKSFDFRARRDRLDGSPRFGSPDFDLRINKAC